MGLLDQVIGQVIGGMMQGRAEPSGRPVPQPGPPSGGGGLGDILGKLGGGAAGKYSPLVLALLALLANKHLSTGAGGYGSVLGDILGKLGGGQAEPADGPPQAGGGMSGGGMGGGLDEALRDMIQRGGGGAPQRGRSGDGGFLDDVGSMMDDPRHPQSQAVPREAGGGALGGGLGGGLGGLLEHFARNGQGQAMESWIGDGPNQDIDPDQLDGALGPGTVDELSRATGMGRDELLGQLSEALPQVIDKLTPQGRMPTEDEQSRWI